MVAMTMAEPHKISAGALAILVHGIFFAILFASFSWQMKPPQGMVVEIWDSLPVDNQEPIPEPPQVQPENPVPVTPKYEAPPVTPAKADIDLKSKKKKEREAEQKKLENIAAQKLAEKNVKDAEQRREGALRQASQHKAQEEAAIAAGKVVDEYISRIAARVRRFIVLPPDVAANIKAEFNVTLLPSGEVLSANLIKPSGNEAYDNAVERAILKAQPLPLPPSEQNLFNRFRELRLKFSPAESGR
jgi:colicin import membrane protein